MIKVSWFQGFGEISFFLGQILDSQKFVGDSHVKLAPPANYPTVVH